jgi:hypothetical protein
MRELLPLALGLSFFHLISDRCGQEVEETAGFPFPALPMNVHDLIARNPVQPGQEAAASPAEFADMLQRLEEGFRRGLFGIHQVSCPPIRIRQDLGEVGIIEPAKGIGILRCSLDEGSLLLPVHYYLHGEFALITTTAKPLICYT